MRGCVVRSEVPLGAEQRKSASRPERGELLEQGGYRLKLCK